MQEQPEVLEPVQVQAVHMPEVRVPPEVQEPVRAQAVHTPGAQVLPEVSAQAVRKAEVPVLPEAAHKSEAQVLPEAAHKSEAQVLPDRKAVQARRTEVLRPWKPDHKADMPEDCIRPEVPHILYLYCSCPSLQELQQVQR